MKRTLLVSLALLAVCATAAFAAPMLNLAWDTCVGDGGSSLRTFACTSNSNAGTFANVLVPSVVFDEPVVDFNGFDTHILIRTPTLLPAWYGVGCTGKTGPVAASGPSSLCSSDPFAALGAGGQVPLGGTDLYPSPTTLQIRFAYAVPEGDEQLLVPGEYPTCNITISNAKSTGTGACTGCLTPACLNFSFVTYGTKGGFAFDVTSGLSPVCFWQAQSFNCFIVPTRNQTWGAIKALYR